MNFQAMFLSLVIMTSAMTPVLSMEKKEARNYTLAIGATSASALFVKFLDKQTNTMFKDELQAFKNKRSFGKLLNLSFYGSMAAISKPFVLMSFATPSYLIWDGYNKANNARNALKK